jgi:hypothetical protein
MWLASKPFLPDLSGKTVLEVGSIARFFCLQFSVMGAKSVTGV